MFNKNTVFFISWVLIMFMTIGTEPVNADLVSETVTQTAATPSYTDVTQEDTAEPVNNASIPQMDSMSDDVRWRGPAENPSHSDSDSTPGDHISIRVKFMENERTMSVNSAITVGELKR